MQDSDDNDDSNDIRPALTTINKSYRDAFRKGEWRHASTFLHAKMSSIQLEGMPHKSRFKTITEVILPRTAPTAFRECQRTPEPMEAQHGLTKRVLDVEREKLFSGSTTARDTAMDKFVKAIVGLERDVRRHGGRLFSLRPKMDEVNFPRMDQLWSTMVAATHDIGNRTCFYNVGNGTIVRVRGTTLKMYLSHADDFHDYAKPGYFLDNYYVPGRTREWDVVTLNILSGHGGEMPFHFELASHEEAIALLLGRYNEELREQLVRAVLFGEAVTQNIASSRNISGAVVRADDQAYDYVPTDSMIMCMLLQQLGAEVDDSARREMDEYTFYRISGPNEALLLGNYEWLVNARLVCAVRDEAADGRAPVRRNLFFKNQKLFRKGYRRTIFVLSLFVTLLGLGAYAVLGQKVGPAEKVEKALSLLLVGVLVAVFTLLSARKGEDLVSDILGWRVEIKDSRELNEDEFKEFLYMLQTDEDAHEALKPDRALWVRGEKTGGAGLHRLVCVAELCQKELKIRENGDLFFGNRKCDSYRSNARKARLTANGLLHVGASEEPSYGFRIETGNVELWLM